MAGKIVIGFYMLLTKVGDVYLITLPAAVRQFMSTVTIGISLGLASTECGRICLGRHALVADALMCLF